MIVGDFVYRFAYQATLLDYKYGKPEYRPNRYKKTNVDNHGALCKHLTAILSNKRWLQQITSRLMDWVEKNINKINKFLNRKAGDELTLPNELARQNAKLGWQNRRNQVQDEEEPEEVETNNSEDANNEPKTPNNVQGNNPSTNRANGIDSEEEENEEEQ